MKSTQRVHHYLILPPLSRTRRRSSHQPHIQRIPPQRTTNTFTRQMYRMWTSMLRCWRKGKAQHRRLLIGGLANAVLMRVLVTASPAPPTWIPPFSSHQISTQISSLISFIVASLVSIGRIRAKQTWSRIDGFVVRVASGWKLPLTRTGPLIRLSWTSEWTRWWVQLRKVKNIQTTKYSGPAVLSTVGSWFITVAPSPTRTLKPNNYRTRQSNSSLIYWKRIVSGRRPALKNCSILSSANQSRKDDDYSKSKVRL